MSYVTVPTHNPGDTFPSADWNIVANNENTGLMRKLADTTLGASTASIDFTSIPATFAHLLLVYSLRFAEPTISDWLILRLNNDSGANYNRQVFYGQNAAANAGGQVGQTSMRIGLLPGSSSPAGRFGVGFILIPNYAIATPQKAAFAGSHESGDDTAPNQIAGVFAGTWKNTAIVNEVTIFGEAGAGSPNLDTGSRATLYGLPS